MVSYLVRAQVTYKSLETCTFDHTRMCMQTYTHTIHTHTHTHTHTHEHSTHVYITAHTHASPHTHTHTRMHKDSCARVCTHTHGLLVMVEEKQKT